MNVEEEILLECELILMNVHYDLVRWHEELEQARYATHLDGIIEWQFAKPAEDLAETVPLTVYEHGQRREIGIAKVSLMTGDVTASFNDEHYASLLQSMPKGSYSIGYDQESRQVRVRPVPYSKLEQYRRETEDLAKLVGLIPTNPNFPGTPNWHRWENGIRENANAGPENDSSDRTSSNHLPKLRRPWRSDESGGRQEFRMPPGTGSSG